MAVTLIVRGNGNRKGSVLGVSCDGRTFIRVRGRIRRGKVLDLGSAWFHEDAHFPLTVRFIRWVPPNVVRPMLAEAGESMWYGDWHEVLVD